MDDSPILISAAARTHLGRVWVAASARGMVAVEFGACAGSFRSLVRKMTGQEPRNGQGQLLAVTRQLAEYLEGDRRAFELAIDWSVIPSEFQRRALRAVVAIPYGATRTYAQIAARIGQPLAARAVGRANATNPMPLVIPCHRVVGSDGRLHGYGGAGGLHTKAWLLKMEATHA